MRVDVQPAVEVDDQEGVERFVEGAVFGLGDGVAEVDPDAVGDAVVVVVDVPGADRFPKRNGDVGRSAARGGETPSRSAGREAGLLPSKLGWSSRERAEADLPLDGDDLVADVERDAAGIVAVVADAVDAVRLRGRRRTRSSVGRRAASGQDRRNASQPVEPDS